MTRIEMNGDIQRAPREVRAARRVIQNWMQIENESQIIRKHQKASNKAAKLIIDSDDIKRYKQHSKASNISTRQTQKNISTKNQKVSKIKKPLSKPSSSSFDKKFARMKSQAMNRQKKDNFEAYKNQLLSVHKESKIKTKKMVDHVFECKEEEVIHDDGVYNAEQRVRYDLIPSCRLNNKIHKHQQSNSKRMETRKVLVFQLNEIEKQEKYHNKKLLSRICTEWKRQCIRSKEMEQNALNLYRNNLVMHTFREWMDYTNTTKQLLSNIFKQWNAVRSASKDQEIRAIGWYESGLQDNVFFVWRDYTKQCIETRKIRNMQLQTRLYKMNKIAKRHYKYAAYCKFIKYWKLYTNEEQTKRFLEQQREKRKLKIQSLISSVKTKTNSRSLNTENAIDQEPESKDMQTPKQRKQELKIKKESKLISIKTVEPKKMISHSIQTDTEEKLERAQSVNHSKQIKRKPRGVKSH